MSDDFREEFLARYSNFQGYSDEEAEQGEMLQF